MRGVCARPDAVPPSPGGGALIPRRLLTCGGHVGVGTRLVGRARARRSPPPPAATERGECGEGEGLRGEVGDGTGTGVVSR